MRLLNPYEAHCAAWWLWNSHDHSKAAAARAVDRGGNSSEHQWTWFKMNVLGMRKPDNRESPCRQHSVRAERDARYFKFKQTPYYKFLKEAGVDLRTLPTIRSK